MSVPKEHGVFASKNLESLTNNLTKKELQSLINIIQNKIKMAYYYGIVLGSDDEFLRNFPNDSEKNIEILRGRFKNGLKCPKYSILFYYCIYLLFLPLMFQYPA